ncbi:MAG: hypothetical protein ACK42Y_10580, partial [Candidatus Thermochlorobacter sp.]
MLVSLLPHLLLAQPEALRFRQGQPIPRPASMMPAPQVSPNELIVKFKPSLPAQTFSTLQAACLSARPATLRLGNLRIPNATVLALTPKTLGKSEKTLQISRLREIDRIVVIRLESSISALDVEHLLAELLRNPDVEYATRVRLLSLDTHHFSAPA